MNKKRTLLILAALLFAAAAAPKTPPRINPPTIMPAEDALFKPDIMWMDLAFIEIDRGGDIRVWGHLMGSGWSAVPAVLFTRGGKWMAAVYDNSPDLAQTGFWYVGRDSSGYVAVIDCEIEGAFGELILARSADGIKWRPVRVMKKESYTQLFQELRIFDGGRWEISISPPADQPQEPDYIYESRDSGRSWRLSRKEIPTPFFSSGFEHHYLSPQIAARGNRVFSVVKISGKIENPRYRPE